MLVAVLFLVASVTAARCRGGGTSRAGARSTRTTPAAAARRRRSSRTSTRAAACIRQRHPLRDRRLAADPRAGSRRGSWCSAAAVSIWPTTWPTPGCTPTTARTCWPRSGSSPGSPACCPRPRCRPASSPCACRGRRPAGCRTRSRWARPCRCGRRRPRAHGVDGGWSGAETGRGVDPRGEAAEAPLVLAFSGGGIRSASFCLGGFNALQDMESTREIDAMVSVSGGSYAASAIALTRTYAGDGTRPQPSAPMADLQIGLLPRLTRSWPTCGATAATSSSRPGGRVSGLWQMLGGAIINVFLAVAALRFFAWVLGWYTKAVGIVSGLDGRHPRFRVWPDRWVDRALAMGPWALPAGRDRRPARRADGPARASAAASSAGPARPGGPRASRACTRITRARRCSRWSSYRLVQVGRQHLGLRQPRRLDGRQRASSTSASPGPAPAPMRSPTRPTARTPSPCGRPGSRAAGPRCRTARAAPPGTWQSVAHRRTSTPMTATRP